MLVFAIFAELSQVSKLGELGRLDKYENLISTKTSTFPFDLSFSAGAKFNKAARFNPIWAAQTIQNLHWWHPKWPAGRN